jgi:hemolysin III
VASSTPRVKPRLRGVSHQWAFVLAVPLGIAVGLAADSSRARVAAAIFAGSVVAMFGLSALYHRPMWTPRRRLLLARLDHAGVYGLIAGSYTPFGLLAVEGTWRVAVLAIVWGGALVAVVAKLAWVTAPKWLAATIGIALGWVGVILFPQLLAELGLAMSLLVLLGGLCYTAGAAVYVVRRPDPLPRTFGYHEVFHALVIAGVAAQYVAVVALVA